MRVKWDRNRGTLTFDAFGLTASFGCHLPWRKGHDGFFHVSLSIYKKEA